MPRMVVLWHEISDGDTFDRASHFDVMLESGEALWTWALNQWPLKDEQQVSAKRLADHRFAYLEYEGPISGGRGNVRRVDQGEYQLVKRDSDRLELKVCTVQFSGRIQITHNPSPSFTAKSEP